MLKKIMYLTFTVFVLSLFTYQNICHAHRFKSNPPFEGHTETIKAWLIAYDDMDAKQEIMTNKHAIFVGAKSAVEKLNSIWSSHQQKLADGNTAIVKNVANTFIALIGAITTKGASTVTYLPTVFATYGAAEAGVKKGSIEFDLAKYEKALDNSLSDMDAALDALKVNYPLYKKYYNVYLEACANHQITRKGEWNKTYTQAEIDTAVNMKHLTSDWYHQSESQGTHTIYARGSWSFSDLPYTYNCNSTGTCAVKYRTPYQAYYDHREKCGTDASYSQLVRAYLPDSYTTGNFTFELGVRTVEQGCGQEWYNCDAKMHAVHTPRHMIRKCNITILKKGGGSYKCPDSFRKCMYHKRDHDERAWKYGLTEHSETDSSNKEVSSPVQTITPPPTPSPTPDSTTYHACGVHTSDVSGDHFAAGCGSSEHYVCDGSDHSWVYESCSALHAHYACDGADHSLQASCSETDSHGQSCTVTNFYACQSHTHQYPALISGACGHSYTASSSYSHRSETCPKNSRGDSCTIGSYYVCKSHTHQYPAPKRTCWRSDCGVEVTNAADHKEACGSGDHSYWPGCPDLSIRWWHQRSTHTEITCKRCGVKFRPCSNTKTCKNGWGHKK